MSTDQVLRVSEIFESIQGEGASAGTPCVFLRLSTCNLRCSFCDTRYTWDWDAHRYEDEVRHVEVTSVASEIERRAQRRLVVTGGEPLLQQRALVALLERLGDAWTVEVETNGTMEPAAELVARVSQWNVSPKLGNSGEPRERRLQPGALTSLRDTGRAWLKWVVASAADAEEAAELTEHLEWPADRVLFMPRAATRLELAANARTVEVLARRHGFGVSPRLHIERWDGRRGV